MAQKWEGEEEHRQLQSIMCHARAIIYIEREREKERESIQQEINFFSKSFRQHLSQLDIYIKILLQF